MLDWLGRLFDSAVGLIPSPIRNLVHTAVHAIAGVMITVFHDVTGAWDDLVHTAADIEEGAWHLGRSTWRKFNQIVTHLIPHYAMVAWWWVTNPDKLAETLFWWILRLLEHYAWEAGELLGEFFLALVLRNIRRFLHLIEAVLAAVI